MSQKCTKFLPTYILLVGRHMKSFAEREEEKEARRKHFQVSQYQQRRLDPRFKKVEISRQFLKAIASTVGQDGEARHVNSAKSSSSECVRPDNGFEFSQDELEKDRKPTINVQQLVGSFQR